MHLENLTIDESGLSKAVVAQFRHLEELKINSGGSSDARQQTVTVVKNAVPKCRLSEIKETAASGSSFYAREEVVVKLSPGGVCCSAD